jgi:hypothetical protein
LDGASNLQEFSAGTDPRDAASVLRVQIDVLGNTARLAFSAGAGRGYTLQFQDSLGQGTWVDLTNFPAEQTNRTLRLVDPLPPGVTRRFYRVTLP